MSNGAEFVAVTLSRAVKPVHIVTGNSCLTAYSDYSDGLEAKPKFWSDTEYLAYLDGFAKKFDLYKYINFRTRVENIKRCPTTGVWHVKYRKNRYSPPHRAYDPVPEEDPDVSATS